MATEDGPGGPVYLGPFTIEDALPEDIGRLQELPGRAAARDREQLRAEVIRRDEEARLRPPAGHPCVVCGGELIPTVRTEIPEAFPRPIRRSHSGYVCGACHLVYGTEAAAGERP